MPRRTLAVFAAAAAALTLAVAGTAHAGPPGTWTQMTGFAAEDPNTLRVGLARTNEGTLHVLWTRQEGGNARSVQHTSVSADATTVGGPVTVFTGPDGVNNNLDLVRAPDGSLRAFFAATNVFDSVMASATSPDGNAWTLEAPVSKSGPPGKPVYAAAGIGAAAGPDGTFYSAWGGSSPSGAGYHVGLDPNAPDGEFPGGLATDPDVGVDSATGQVVAAWNSLDLDAVAVMPIAPGASHATIPTSAPYTLHRVGITGRIGAPGVFVAFGQGTNPFLADPAVYRSDTGATTTITGSDGELISIAAAPEGRLWVFWADEADRINATRSNPDATAWGRIVRLTGPDGTRTVVYDLAGEASLGPLDLFAHMKGPLTSLATYHQRILPGLSFSAKKSKGTLVVTVTDAGQAVSGAKVKVKGKGSKTTGQAGSAKFKLKKGRYKVTASKAGYAPFKKKVRVK